MKTPGPGAYDDMREVHYNCLTGSAIGRDKRNSYFLKTTVSGNPDAYD